MKFRIPTSTPIPAGLLTTFVLLLLSLLCSTQTAVASDPPRPHPQPQTGPFATPVTDALIDDSASAEWVEGTNRSLANPTALRNEVWTASTTPTGIYLQYGASPQPGTRHLRLGLNSPVSIGSILVRGGDQVSVLRPNAPYPGNLADESQWLPAQRILNQALSTANVDIDTFALWAVPQLTRTRAIRFTHTSVATDSNYAGTLGGVYLLSSRLANLAPQAIVTTSSNSNAAHLLTDENWNRGHGWDNGPDFLHPVTVSSPEWIMLTWPHPVPLNGLAALWAGFSAADVQAFDGPDNLDPHSAPASNWKPISTYALRSQYPRPLAVDWFDFGKIVTTRAIRLRLTQVIDESAHPQLVGSTKKGNRVWLFELMALSPLATRDLQTAILTAPASASNAPGTSPHPPIAIPFTLDAPGYVTLVIDDDQGNRVRNLVSDTWFEKGPNTAWWDGADDLGRNLDAANHGVYLIPTQFVTPGKYQVHGLYHQAIDLHYEFSIYNSGHPAWETLDGKGGWLTTHTPPSSALFVPAATAPGGKPLVYLGSYISEGGSGLAWVDLDGNKQGGREWIGGAWTAAPYLARDSGPSATPAIYAYAASVLGDDSKDPKQPRAVLHITGLTAHGDKSILNFRYDPGATVSQPSKGFQDWFGQIGGLAVHNNLIAVSLTATNQLLFVDANTGKYLGISPVDNPRGLAFDSRGALLVLSGTRVTSYTLPAITANFTPVQLPAPQTLISSGLEDPTGITLSSDDTIYISDRGSSNQVHVYSRAGKFLQTIGDPGPPQAGPYDPLHMNNPRGLAIDSNDHLWVAEEDFSPKRVSLWTRDGKFLRAFYGPPEYGGGGSLDPKDKTLFYYHGMEFKLDWKTGTDALASILYRPDKDPLSLPVRINRPASPIYLNGHRYFDNTYLNAPTTGVTIAFLFLDTAGLIRPVAAFGKANDWDLLKSGAFRARLPQGADLTDNSPAKSVLFNWSDSNGNGKVDPEEVTFTNSTTGWITIMPDLAMIDSFVDGKVSRFAPTSFTANGTPIYDIAKGSVLLEGAQRPASDGGGQVLYSPSNTVLTTAPLPYKQQSVGGVDSNNHRWSYPSLWPGLHPAHSAPLADHPGELIGTTRLMGDFFTPPNSAVGPLWAINGNFGNMYLFTADGLYVTSLFQDVRTGKSWNMPTATRDMPMNDVSPHDENFYPSITETSDGQTYVVDGARTSLIRVDGLGSLHPIPKFTVQLTPADLQKARAFLTQQESSRQLTAGRRQLTVTIQSGPPPQVTALVDSLKSADWALVDQRINQAGWNRSQDQVSAAITIAGGRLFAAFRTNDPNLLTNSGSIPNAPFKSGGALDLMIGTNPSADASRQTPVPGDLRLLIYQVNGKPRATLYRALVPGTRTPVPFSSPDRTITIDQVQDVSNLVDLSASVGNYAFSIPLSALGLNPIPGQHIQADIGILRGNGEQTTQRVYWSNKATGITSDVPSEAELTPSLWGQWNFAAAP